MKSSFEPRKDEDLELLNIDKSIDITLICVCFIVLSSLRKNISVLSLCQVLFSALEIQWARRHVSHGFLEGKKIE